MIKRKRAIDILGVKHKVKHIDTGDNDGYYDSDNKLVEISNEITDQEKYDYTVFHEGAHGVFQVSGIQQDISLPQEHAIIDSMWAFIKKNFEIKLKCAPKLSSSIPCTGLMRRNNMSSIRCRSFFTLQILSSIRLTVIFLPRT